MLCSSKDCENEAYWQLRVRAWARNHPKVPGTELVIVTGLVACNVHRKHPGPVAELFSEEGQRIIQNQLRQAGKEPLDFNTAQWDFAALTPELAALLARGQILAGKPS